MTKQEINDFIDNKLTLFFIVVLAVLALYAPVIAPFLLLGLYFDSELEYCRVTSLSDVPRGRRIHTAISKDEIILVRRAWK